MVSEARWHWHPYICLRQMGVHFSTTELGDCAVLSIHYGKKSKGPFLGSVLCERRRRSSSFLLLGGSLSVIQAYRCISKLLACTEERPSSSFRDARPAPATLSSSPKATSFCSPVGRMRRRDGRAMAPWLVDPQCPSADPVVRFGGDLCRAQGRHVPELTAVQWGGRRRV